MKNNFTFMLMWLLCVFSLNTTAKTRFWNNTFENTPISSTRMPKENASAIVSFWPMTSYFRLTNRVNSSSTKWSGVENFTTPTDQNFDSQSIDDLWGNTSTDINGVRYTGDPGANRFASVRKTSDVSPNPAFSGRAILIGNNISETGAFSEAINEPTTGTTNYVRTNAVNSIGKGYGSEESFSTSSAVSPSSNNALHFDSDAKITNLSGISPTSFTIEFWLKSQYQSPVDANKQYQGIYWQNSASETGVYMDNYDVGSNYGTQTLAITPSASNSTTYQAWATGVDDGDISPAQQATWRHYAITSNGTSISFYYDGVLIRTQTYSGAILPISNVTIGGTYGLNGFTLDELRIWNFAKTQVQIQAQKDTEVSPSASGLVRYYNFNQGTANGNNTAVTSLPELTGNGTTATLSNFTLNGSTSNWVDGPLITSVEPVSNTAPTLTTSAVTAITATGATFSGNVTADGGATVSERGFVYGTTTNPTTANTKVQDGTGIGTFTENITGLTAGTTYYVRAYAIDLTFIKYNNRLCDYYWLANLWFFQNKFI